MFVLRSLFNFARTVIFTVTFIVAIGMVLAGCTSVRESLEAGSRRREFVIDNTWSRATTKKEFLGFRRMNRMSPIVLEKMVIQANAIDGLLAFDRGSGRQLWRLDLPNGVEGGAQFANGRIYFGASDGQFYCVSAADGKVLWAFAVRAETLAPPTVDGGVVYFESGADVVFALDAETGKQLWTYNRQVTGSLSIRATSRPVIAGEALLVGFSDGFLVSLKKHDGGLNWEKKLGKSVRFRDVDATPVLDGKNLYVASFDAALYSIEIETGDINWSVEDGGYLPVTIGTGRYADRLFYATANGKILVVDKASGKKLKIFDIKHGIATQPVIFKGFMIYGESEGAVIFADAENGAPLKRFVSGEGLMAKPTFVEATNEAFFISNAANLYALKFGFQRASDRLPWQVPQ